jgi:hypothetical protein
MMGNVADAILVPHRTTLEAGGNDGARILSPQCLPFHHPGVDTILRDFRASQWSLPTNCQGWKVIQAGNVQPPRTSSDHQKRSHAGCSGVAQQNQADG